MLDIDIDIDVTNGSFLLRSSSAPPPAGCAVVRQLRRKPLTVDGYPHNAVL
jgi:hypothetical protein